MPLRIALLVLMIVSTSACQSSFFGALNLGSNAPDVEVQPTRVYAPESALALDVYRPQSARAAPLVVFFFGGRWSSGERGWYRFVGEALAARGFVTLIPDYRLFPAAKFPAFMEDAAAAVAWGREHAAELGADPAKVFVVGHSAGAHMAALLATDGRYLAQHRIKPRDLAGVVGIAGPYDFLPLTDDDLKDMFGPPERYLESQPVRFVDGDEPPFLLLHGLDDHLVWLRNSKSLARHLRAAGESVMLKTYPDLGHIRILSALSLRHHWLAPTLQDVTQFIELRSAEIDAGCCRAGFSPPLNPNAPANPGPLTD